MHVVIVGSIAQRADTRYIIPEQNSGFPRGWMVKQYASGRWPRPPKDSSIVPVYRWLAYEP